MSPGAVTIAADHRYVVEEYEDGSLLFSPASIADRRRWAGSK